MTRTTTFMKKLIPVYILLHAGISGSAYAAGISPITSDLNDSFDGWTCVNELVCSDPGTGGAGGPGDGFLRFTDLLIKDLQADILAPTSYLGDYSSAQGMTFEFDFKVFDVGAAVEKELQIAFFSGGVSDFDGGESAVYKTGLFFDNTNTPTDWVHVVVPLDFSAPGWIVDQGFNSSNVNVLRLPGDWVKGQEELGYDNFSVEAVPIPGAAWLFGSGLLGLIGAARRKA